MKDSEFQKLLDKAAKMKAEHCVLLEQIREECKRRYGHIYNDIDADGIIDGLEVIGGISLPLRKFDSEMRLSIEIHGLEIKPERS